MGGSAHRSSHALSYSPRRLSAPIRASRCIVFSSRLPVLAQIIRPPPPDKLNINISINLLNPPPYLKQAEVFLKAHGLRYQIVVLEEQGMKEQVRLFAQAPVVVAIHGSGLSNLLFSPQGSALVEVGVRGNKCYVTLSGKMGLGYAHAHNHAADKGFSSEIQKLVLKALAHARITFPRTQLGTTSDK
ncbi:hypothetical protein T492DRAFT_44109 [Pavlovales sp. CCMP2436]|nr:hypothetical protein T492DRAFT_44109 [Pavlovales sp. CCMP2436]